MSEILYEQRDRLVFITINRPQALNAINTEMWRGLIEAFIRFREDTESRVAIVTGAGDRSFSVGNDVKEMAQNTDKTEEVELSASTLPSLNPEEGLKVWKPIIAAINGHCLGAGFFIALSCDIRIASDNATFAVPEVKLGLMPDMGATQWLPRVMPVCNALELIMSGRTITAPEALQFGFINRVVPQQELLPTAENLAQQICDNGPLAVSLAKQAVYQGLGMNLMEGLNLEKKLYETALQSEDLKEGIQAFVERRKPNYKGS